MQRITVLGAFTALLLVSPRFALANPGSPGPAVLRSNGIVRVDRSGSFAIGSDNARHQRLLAQLRARSADLGLADALAGGLVLHAKASPTLSSDRLELVRVTGSFAGTPLSRPVARALVDLSDGGRVRLLTADGAIAPLAAGAEIRLSEKEAITLLEQSGLVGSTGASEAELVAVPGKPTTWIAWRIDPPPDLARATNPVYLVDAHDGAIRLSHDRARAADVVAFELNPVKTPVAAQYSLVDIDPDPPHLIGTYFEARNCNEKGNNGRCTSNATAFPDGDGNFFYDVPDVTIPEDNEQLNDTFAEVSIYYHADKLMASLRDIGFPGIPCHVDGQRAVLIANYKRWDEGGTGDWTPYDNAFYTGNCDGAMAFGQGTTVDFSYDGDVIYHELGHGVVEQQMGGAWLGASRALDEALVVDAGGVNEAISDFVSASFAGDPVLAEYVAAYWDKVATEGIRHMDNEFVCPNDLIGEVHADGEPLAAVLWEVYLAHGAASIPLVLDVIAAFPGTATTLEEACVTLETVADAALGADAAAAIHDDVVERNLVDCLRVIEPGMLRKAMHIRSQGHYQPFAPPPLQVRFDVPEGADSLELTFDVYTDGNESGDGEDVYDVAIQVRYGEPITYTYVEGNDTTTLSGDYEETFDDVDSGTASIPVQGTTPIFISFVNVGEDWMLVDNIVADYPGAGSDTDTDTGTDSGTGTPSEGDDGGTDDGGTDDGDDGSTAPDDGSDGTTDSATGDEDGKAVADHADDGCGCSLPGHGRDAALVGVPLLLLTVRRRRRRA